MGLSSAADVDRFIASPAVSTSWHWLDDQGRVCSPLQANMLRLTKRVGKGYLTVVVDAAEPPPPIAELVRTR